MWMKGDTVNICEELRIKIKRNFRGIQSTAAGTISEHTTSWAYVEPGKAVDSLKMLKKNLKFQYALEVGGMDSSGLWYGPVACYCEQGNWPSGSIKGCRCFSTLYDSNYGTCVLQVELQSFWTLSIVEYSERADRLEIWNNSSDWD
jgi:hypothetical protein